MHLYLFIHTSAIEVAREKYLGTIIVDEIVCVPKYSAYTSLGNCSVYGLLRSQIYILAGI